MPAHLNHFRASVVAPAIPRDLVEACRMIVLSHPTGNENVRQAALALAEANLLREFWTTLNWNPDSIFDKTVPAKLRRTFRRRAYPEIVRRRIHSLPLREAARLLLGNANVPLFSNTKPAG